MQEELKSYILSNCLHFCIDNNNTYQRIKNSIYLFDLRELVLHPIYGRMAAAMIWERIKPYAVRMLFGKGSGAIPLMSLIQQVAKEQDGVDVNILICRDARKTTNRKRWVEGIRPANAPRAMFIDDLTNTGTTYRDCVKAIDDEGIPLRIVGAAGIVDMWSFTGTRKLAVQNHKIEYLFKRHDLGLSRVTPSTPIMGNLVHQVRSINSYPAMDLKSPPVFDENRVYWATDNHQVYCMDTSSGEILWMFTSPEQEDWQPKGIVNKMLIDDTGIYFNTYNGLSFKLDKLTGETLWITRPSRWVHSSSTPSADGSKIYIATESRDFSDESPKGDVVCMDSATGRELWRFATDNLAPCTPYVSGNRVYACNNANAVFCIDGNTGKLVWQQKMRGAAKGRMLVANGMVYATTESGFIYAFNATNGQLIAVKLIANGIRHNFLTEHQGLIYILDIDGLVKAYDYSLTLKWISRVRGALSWYPLIKNDTMYVSTRDGYCFALNALTGNKIGLAYVANDAAEPTIINSALAVSDEHIAFHTTNKGLVVYELSN